MSEAFAGSFELIDDTARASAPPVQYADWVRQKLTDAKPGDPGILRVRIPRPTAAFSPQDRSHPEYHRIAGLMQAQGFEPIERGTGGRLTVFDEGALGVTLVAPHADPHSFMMERYEIFAGAIANGLRELGIDARIGELPNEYCPGKFSINAGGRVKLVGVAQRMTKRGYQMGAVIAYEQSLRARAAIADAYREMGLAFDPATYGAVKDYAPDVSQRDAARIITTAVIEGLGLQMFSDV